ncbi:MULTISPECIES: threonine synthase [Thermodesulfovibrio]|jgi:threonine synthase|uniref:threonine synthase n=1 Tax=Thermodesulfovibrio TaxID=28261 RepID=UPI0026343420|nr:threonine synthase [Thermodesulfovibrio sp.]
MNAKSPWRGIIREYFEHFPVSEKTPVVTLLEGNTPLIRVNNLCRELNIDLEIFLKFDGANPTGSFKDRGMTLAISKAVEEGSRAVICASTGNTSASASAYAARAGIKAIVLIPEGKIATGKLVQAMIHGALVIQIKGNFDQALNIVRAIVNEYPITLVNSINPFRIEGQKSAAFEVCDQLGRVPDYHALPVGNAGNISAYWKGYKEYMERGKIKTLPKMLGFQAAGAAPIVLGHPVEKPETVATAIRIGNPASWKTAVQARDESGGTIDTVTDDEILQTQKMIASLEGVFCEPASAASVAGVIKLYRQGYFKKDSTVVCTLTGNGLKDPDIVFKVAAEPYVLPPDLNSVRDFVEKLL